ncbi:spore germination lipoprotein GerD [Ectobacillus antri]|jgi:spore germination protein D|uniref:Spore germination lipoprotein GerD n=1 Tax=Ectobacillus antri TaxID=2486280 RepID=A0ABT6H657_9BACI|nr:spore germination lipoprotein GerD [Ectobacillus antri]MDG4657902.1 spore germination lipoprotein GerD [Ectobacillus antri]MDG5754845.1 spore germination lipoprotein GerD [Ectobacillus antri]
MKRIPLLLCFLLLTTACAQPKQAESQPDYDQTKKMVVDILKTDSGKKAIEQVLADEKIKQTMVLDEAVVKKTIEDVMMSEKGQQFWEKAFTDPQFVAAFAKSMEKEQAKLMKTLLKDPEYQAGVIDIMKNPEIEKQMMEVMKSKEYRKHVQQVITETTESPLFQAKMIDVISKAIKKAEKSGEESTGSSKTSNGEGNSQNQQEQK